MCMHARMCVCVYMRASICLHARACVSARAFAPNVRAFSIDVDCVWFGSQAFCQASYAASVFNANIGAWNTARVTMLSWVCAAFGRRRAPLRMLSAVLDERARMCACAHA